MQLSDEELDSYEDRFKSKEKQLHAFHQVRLSMVKNLQKTLPDIIFTTYQISIKKEKKKTSGKVLYPKPHSVFLQQFDFWFHD